MMGYAGKQSWVSKWTRGIWHKRDQKTKREKNGAEIGGTEIKTGAASSGPARRGLSLLEESMLKGTHIQRSSPGW